MTVPKPNFSRCRYFPIQEKWRKLGPIFRSKEARSIWHPCMEEFMQQRAEQNKYPYRPQPDAQFPTDYESCDWRCETPYSKQPKFWDYARHSACHWVVDLCLYAAKRAYPDVPWRILTARHHTTVWSGDMKNPVLFDVNFLAMGVKASEALRIAWRGRMLRPGRHLKHYLMPKELLAA